MVIRLRDGAARVILLLHNRYRTPGGEERVVEDLARLLPQELGEDVRVLERVERRRRPRDGRGRACCAAGCGPTRSPPRCARSGARVVHAHNVHPQLGWRALEAARDAGARTVLHLHNYRLVCAVGTCFTRGEDCTRCHGRDTRPGLRLRCRGSRRRGRRLRGGARAWRRRLVAAADALVAPSAFAVARLRELGAPLDGREVHVVANPVPRRRADAPIRRAATYAICSARMAPDKGVDVAIEACARAGVPLVVAGDGPDEAGAARAGRAARGRRALRRPRRRRRARASCARAPALAIVPSRFAETFGLCVRRGDGRRAAGRRDERPARCATCCPRPTSARRATRRRSPRSSGACGATRQRRAQRGLHRRARRAARGRAPAGGDLRRLVEATRSPRDCTGTTGAPRPSTTRRAYHRAPCAPS